MKIGIDCRFVGPEGTGLGKYTEKLVLNLVKIDKRNTYILFLRKNNWDYLRVSAKNIKRVIADVPWYSFAEQLKLLKIFSRENLDILHVPHFNVPLIYSGKLVITIHDLIHHEFTQESATTRNLVIFKVKRLAYNLVITLAVKKAKKIIAPSNFVREKLIKTFKLQKEKIITIYEAAEEEYFRNQKPETRNQKPFLIYVGNVYPHKNLNKLLDAFKILTTHHSPLTTHLILVCPRDVFWNRLTEQIDKRELSKVVQTRGYTHPKELAALFRGASAYIFPSLSEGFGIPGLNAMAAKLPLLASDIGVFREVYGDAALYFDPKNPKDIAAKIRKVLIDSKERSLLIEKGEKQVKKYSWQKMARETLKVYESINE